MNELQHLDIVDNRGLSCCHQQLHEKNKHIRWIEHLELVALLEDVNILTVLLSADNTVVHNAGVFKLYGLI
jgi:hypothetical protein